MTVGVKKTQFLLPPRHHTVRLIQPLKLLSILANSKRPKIRRAPSSLTRVLQSALDNTMHTIKVVCLFSSWQNLRDRKAFPKLTIDQDLFSSTTIVGTPMFNGAKQLMTYPSYVVSVSQTVSVASKTLYQPQHAKTDRVPLN